VNNRVILANGPQSMGQPDLPNHSMAGSAYPFDDQIEGRSVLTYHEILPSRSQYLYRVSQAPFQEHLSLLASSVSRPSSGEQSTLITFGDGHRSNFEQAFPLLEQFGMKAEFLLMANSNPNATKGRKCLPRDPVIGWLAP
jgi:hypothetical protein